MKTNMDEILTEEELNTLKRMSAYVTAFALNNPRAKKAADELNTFVHFEMTKAETYARLAQHDGP